MREIARCAKCESLNALEKNGVAGLPESRQTLSQMTPVHLQRAVAECNASCESKRIARPVLASWGRRERRVGTSRHVGITGETPQRFPRGSHRARRIAGAEPRTR